MAPAVTPTDHPTPDAERLTAEAAFSLTLKGRLGGQDAQLMIRGGRYAEFAANVAAGRGLLDAAPPATAAGQPTPEGWCLVHQVQMTRQTNERGSWWSHKVGTEWCRGKTKGA